jgi:hypothetical protein
LKPTDENIREIFSQKLSGLESPVSPHLWNGIESQLPQPMAAGTAAGAKTLLGKLLWTAAIAVVTAGTILYYNYQEDKKEIQPSENKEIATPQNSTINSNLPQAESLVQPSTPSTGNTAVLEVYKAPNTAAVATFHYETDPFPSDGYSNTPENVSTDDKNEIEKKASTDITSSEGNSSSGGKMAESSQETITPEFSSIRVPNVPRRYFFIPVCDKCGKKIWSMGDGSDEIESDSPAYTYDQEGEYTVELSIIDNEGKTLASASNKIQVYNPGEIVLPNIFTPNGGGGNDYFDYKIKSSNVQFELIQIWDSNSQLVFENNGTLLWDGADKFGNPCKEGLYRVRIIGSDRYGQKLEKNSTLTIRR